jgi:two-component system chemotaxis response regulator CheB
LHRLLVIDDSPLMRKLLIGIFEAAGDFEVDSARNGHEALAKLATFKPDVVTLDIQMTGMNGLACLDRIMVERPCPVVMVSALTSAGAAETIEALALGAVDFIPKPVGAISLVMEELAPLLVEKVRMAATAKLPGTLRLADRIRLQTGGAAVTRSARRHLQKDPQPLRLSARTNQGETGLVLIGCSTGGPPALDEVIPNLPKDLRWPVIIAQHMPASFTVALAHRLDGISPLTVVEVSRPTVLEPGSVYLARGDADIVISRRGSHLVAMSAPASPAYRWHPSVDRLVESALQHVPAANLLGILMTGMGNDGATAMTALRESGGHTIAESQDTATIWGMPGDLVRRGGAEIVAPVDAIAACITDFLGRP